MSAKPYLATPFAQPQAQGTALSKIVDHPVMIALPVAPGHDDSAMIFRSVLLRTERDGSELRAGLDHMASQHPRVASQVILAGSLGEVSRGRAVDALRTYLATGVAVAPLGL